MKLYDVLELASEEITVLDKDCDIEVYFDGIIGQKEPIDKWTKAKLELAKLLDVFAISGWSVAVNLAEVIERKMPEIKKADFFLIECDIDDILSILMSILAGGVSDKWLTKFVEVLKRGEE